MNRTDLETITDASDRHRITFHRDQRGFFGFQEYVWFDDEDVEDHVIPGGWGLGATSGLYSSLEEAKAGALELAWFKAHALPD